MCRLFITWLLACALPLVGAVSASAQRPVHVVVGVGPFLTRHRGWNFAGNTAVLLGLERAVGREAVRLSVTVRAALAEGENSVALYPPLPSHVGKGVTVSGFLRSRPGPLGLYLLAGPEAFFPQGYDDVTNGTRAAVAFGVGAGGRRWTMESRSSTFRHAVGTTRGHLDVTIVRRF